MATKINASQISTNTSSWYQRLRTIQGNIDTSFLSGTKITQTTDAGLTAGKSIKATDMNTFINALNDLQSNTFLSLADWTNKPATVTAGTAIDEETYTDINTTLTALEGICSNYGTKSTYTNCSDNYVCSDTGCSTTHCSQTANSTNTNSYSTNTKSNSTNTKNSNSNSTNNNSNSTTTNSTNSNTSSNNTYAKYSDNDYSESNRTYSHDPLEGSANMTYSRSNSTYGQTAYMTNSKQSSCSTTKNSTDSYSCKTSANTTTTYKTNTNNNSTNTKSNSTNTKSDGGNKTYNQSYNTCQHTTEQITNYGTYTVK